MKKNPIIVVLVFSAVLLITLAHAVYPPSTILSAEQAEAEKPSSTVDRLAADVEDLHLIIEKLKVDEERLSESISSRVSTVGTHGEISVTKTDHSQLQRQ